MKKVTKTEIMNERLKCTKLH